MTEHHQEDRVSMWSSIYWISSISELFPASEDFFSMLLSRKRRATKRKWTDQEQENGRRRMAKDRRDKWSPSSFLYFHEFCCRALILLRKRMLMMKQRPNEKRKYQQSANNSSSLGSLVNIEQYWTVIYLELTHRIFFFGWQFLNSNKKKQVEKDISLSSRSSNREAQCATKLWNINHKRGKDVFIFFPRIQTFVPRIRMLIFFSIKETINS